MKVAFFFEGTGGNLESKIMYEDRFKVPFQEDVVRVYISGCQHNQVGKSSISPSLSIATEKIKKAFDDKGVLDLDKLKESFKDAIVVVGGEEERKVEPDSLLLTGFSRGAVTALLTAKELFVNKATKHIDVDIVANQPVPGVLLSANHTYGFDLKKYADLRACENIKSADVILGSYDKNNGLLQNNFFAQLAPIFHEATESTFLEIPTTGHLENMSIAIYHVLDRIKNKNKYLKDDIDYEKTIKKLYGETKGHSIRFTPCEEKQKILSLEILALTKDPYYFDSKKEEIKKLQIFNDFEIEAICAQPDDIMMELIYLIHEVVNSTENDETEKQFLKKIYTKYLYKVGSLNLTFEKIKNEVVNDSIEDAKKEISSLDDSDLKEHGNKVLDALQKELESGYKDTLHLYKLSTATIDLVKNPEPKTIEKYKQLAKNSPGRPSVSQGLVGAMWLLVGAASIVASLAVVVVSGGAAAPICAATGAAGAGLVVGGASILYKQRSQGMQKEMNDAIDVCQQAP